MRPRPRISLKRDTVMLEKVPPGPCRIDALSPQVAVPQPCCRGLIDLREEALHPIGRATLNRERPTAFAGPIAREQRLSDRWIVLDVLGQGLRTRQEGRQNTPVVRTARKKIPSYEGSLRRYARSISRSGGSSFMTAR